MSAQANTTETTPAFGVLAPQEARAAIRSENARIGLSVSEADEIDMANHLASAVRHDVTNNRTFIVDGAGKARSKMQDGSLVDISVADFIATIQKTVTPASRTRPSPVPVSAEASRTERAVAANAAKRSTEAEAKAAMAVDLVSRFGNPWSTNNKTHMAFITNTNPTLAKQLRSTAGH